jgi:GH15 family glucan-1,4-alpha-glucosidase
MSSTVQPERDADGYLPIESYGAIGNGRTVALVGADGSIDWCAFSRIDRASVFARILDAGKGGYWQIVPHEPWTVQRHYHDDTNVLVTEFTTATGTVELVDLMPSIAFGSDLGVSQTIWDGLLLRFVRGTRGSVRVRMEVRPAFDYARAPVSYEMIPERGALICGGNSALRIACSLPLRVEDGRLVSDFTVSAGESYYAAASYHNTAAAVWTDLDRETADGLLRREIEGWRRWIARCNYTGPYAEHVRRGALVLKLLDYLPSGAMVAAATTSLPEGLGGVRNWDYRYAWIRDTSYALHALHSIGFRDEAEGFLQWVIDVTNDDPSALQIMYRVDGGQDLDEVELEHLDGYKHSRPVRIGNGAHTQRQLDRFGEVVDAAWVHRRFGGVINNDLWEYLVAVVDQVRQRWRVPDSGIWEVRSGQRRMTFSNVMCWVALDRAIQIAELDDHSAPLADWIALRDTIRAEIMTQGISQYGYFSQGFGDDVLDASALSFPLRSFIAVDHPTMRRTIAAVERELTVDGLVARYLVSDRDVNVDGLPGDEGRFVLCSCWLIDCLTGLGELDRARALLEQLLDRANDLLLLAEQVDPATGSFLGNFPQAFSHLGLINSIVNLGRALGDVEHAPDADYGNITGAIPRGPESRRLVHGDG